MKKETCSKELAQLLLKAALASVGRDKQKGER
jgi:hypothetical protein